MTILQRTGSALIAGALQILTSDLVHTQREREVLLAEQYVGNGWFRASTDTTIYTFNWFYVVSADGHSAPPKDRIRCTTPPQPLHSNTPA